MTFYLLEKLLVWRHCHRQSCDVHVGTGPLLLIGDSFHNFVDGIVITSAYLTSFPLGISVTLSTVAHEVPQEIGEFLVYLKSGYRRRQALLLNSISSLTTLLGATLGYVFLSQLRSFSPYLVVFAASGFIYVALADLIPTQRQTSTLAITLLDGLLIVLGITVVGLLSHHH
jgi:zinc and cadmium transporter